MSVIQWIRKRSSTQKAVAITVFAVVIRLLFLYLFPRFGGGDFLDSTRYLRVVYNILRGRGFAEYIRPTAFAPPLFAYFIALVFKIFGQHILIFKVIQAVLGGITCYLVYRMGALLFSPKVGQIASLITALHPELIVLTGFLYTETLYIFLLSVAFFFFIKAFLRKKKWSLWLLAGFFLGLNILTRHVLLLFPLWLLFIVLLRRSARSYFKYVFVCMLMCYAVVTPWIVRNYLIFDRFIPVASGFGGSVWIGSNLSDEGLHQNDSRQKAWNASKQAADDMERDDILLEKAVRNVMKHPFDYGWIVLKKLGRYYLDVYEYVPNGNDEQKNWLLFSVLALCYYPLFALAVTGIFLARKKWIYCIPLWGLLVYTGLVYSFTIVVPRYRIPLLPFFFVYAAYAIGSLSDRKIRSEKKESDSGPVES